MCKCQIQWIDNNGAPTPDDNEAVGTVYRKAHVYILADGRGIELECTQSFLICADHVEQLPAAGMHHWVFEPLKGGR